MGRHHTNRASSTFAAIGTILVLGLTACGSDDDEASSATVAPAATTVAADSPRAGGDVSLTGAETADAPAPADAPAAPESPDVAVPSAGPGTALAIVATVTVEVDDVRQADVDLPALIAEHGGSIYDTDIAVGDATTARATITIKVPPNSLEDLISGLGGVGRLLDRTQTAEDVADQISDTTSRIATARASVERVRALLESATDLNAVVQIESELTVRETALEQLLASQRNLADRVALSTLTVVLTPAPSADVAVVVKTEPRSIGRAWRTGWNGFVTVVHGTAVGAAYAAPYLGIGLIAGGIALVTRRRRRPAT